MVCNWQSKTQSLGSKLKNQVFEVDSSKFCIRRQILKISTVCKALWPLVFIWFDLFCVFFVAYFCTCLPVRIWDKAKVLLFQKFALKTLVQRPTFIWSCKRFFAPKCFLSIRQITSCGFWILEIGAAWLFLEHLVWVCVCWSWLFPSGSLLGPVQRGPMNLSHDPWHYCFGVCRKTAAYGSPSKILNAPMFLSDVMLGVGLLPKDLAQLLWRELWHLLEDLITGGKRFHTEFFARELGQILLRGFLRRCFQKMHTILFSCAEIFHKSI